MSDNSKEIAKKHGLNEQQEKLFDEYIACFTGELANAKLAKVLETEVDRKRAEKQADEYAIRLWELKHEIGSTVAEAVKEYIMKNHM